MDFTAFLIIVINAKKELPPKSSGITSLWTTILQDSILYFMVIVLLQFLTLLFVFITTVRGAHGAFKGAAFVAIAFSAINPDLALRVSFFP